MPPIQAAYDHNELAWNSAPYPPRSRQRTTSLRNDTVRERTSSVSSVSSNGSGIGISSGAANGRYSLPPLNTHFPSTLHHHNSHVNSLSAKADPYPLSSTVSNINDAATFAQLDQTGADFSNHHQTLHAHCTFVFFLSDTRDQGFTFLLPPHARQPCLPPSTEALSYMYIYHLSDVLLFQICLIFFHYHSTFPLTPSFTFSRLSSLFLRINATLKLHTHNFFTPNVHNITSRKTYSHPTALDSP